MRATSLRPIPTTESLRKALSYDERTGEFRWNHRGEMNKSWNARFSGQVAGNVNTMGYRTICINGTAYYAHRLAWKLVNDDEPSELDHIDRDPSNNAIHNLRAVTRTENLMNRRAYKKRACN
jgi:hypothetical protein